MKRLALGWIGILAIATLMAFLAGTITLFGSRRYEPFLFVSASCVTWSILGWGLQNRTKIETVVVGLLSPIVGALVVSTWMLTNSEALHSEKAIAFLGLAVFNGIMMVVAAWWYFLPIGILTAFAIRLMWHRLPPNNG